MTIRLQKTVVVWGDRVEIIVYQKSKSVWIATGTYLGRSFDVKASTSGSAAKLWADAAKYHSN